MAQIPTIYSANSKSLVIDPTTGQKVYASLGNELSNYTRMKTILFQDCFDVYSRSIYASTYNLAAAEFKSGLGTNTIVPPFPSYVSRANLTTGALNTNKEGTRSVLACVNRVKIPRFCIKVLTDNINTEFRMGFYNAANKYAWIEFNPSLDSHWRLTMDDSTGAEYGSTVGGVVGAGVDDYLELWLDSDGTIHWGQSATSIITEISNAGITKKLTADNYYFVFYIVTRENVTHFASVDFIEIEKLK